VLRQDLRQGELDIVVGLASAAPPDARHQWSEEMVWVRGPRIPCNEDDRIPLVSLGESCVAHRVAVEALNKCRRTHETVYVSSGTMSVAAAISAGLGIMAVARSRSGIRGLMVWEDGPLPKLSDIYCGIFIREDGDRIALEQPADAICDTLQPQSIPRLTKRQESPATIST